MAGAGSREVVTLGGGECHCAIGVSAAVVFEEEAGLLDMLTLRRLPASPLEEVTYEALVDA